MRPHGFRSTVDPSAPRAHAICDRCGSEVDHSDLRNEARWAGRRLAATGFLVCDQCLDVPNPQDRTLILPPDPVPIINPRPPQE